MKRRNFLKYAASSVLVANYPKMLSATNTSKSAINKELNDVIKVKFLGTGAADWQQPRDDGEFRRFSSVLIDDHVVIDFTKRSHEILQENQHPDVLFYTHSHADHYDPIAALQAGFKQIYVSNTWYDIAYAEFKKSAQKLSLSMPEITPVFIGQSVVVGDLSFTPLPACHVTEKQFEECVIYLVQKKNVRLLYATDTSSLTAKAVQIAHLDINSNPKKPLTAIIMEATIGQNRDEGFRLFSHSSVVMVEHVVEVLKKNKTYAPPAGQFVYLTHMAKTLTDSRKIMEQNLPSSLKAAYDGLEVVFR